MEENKEKVAEEPKVDNKVEKLKIKKKPKTNSRKYGNSQDDVIKVDLDKPLKPEENEEKEKVANSDTNDERVVTNDENTGTTQEQEKVQPEAETQETPILEEITEDSTKKEVTETEEKIEEIVAESETTGKPLPENIQKLVDFMEETGGDIGDYVKLNQDYSKLNDQDLLYEYYKQTKPHLNNEEINFLMEDSFSYDEEVDEDIDIRRKKLALKEQVASAKTHLEGQKSRYYEDIKAGSKLTVEQQKAIDFFNKYKKESETTQKAAKQNSDIFTKKTDQVFDSEFKGFEYNVGDKNYRFNVNNVDEVKENQSDLNNFTKKFLDKRMALTDAIGYHKSLYTAMNADAVAKHFYEQGKADAMKDSVSKSKNIDMNPRQAHNEVNVGGIKARVLGESSSDFKFRIKNKK